MKKHHHDPLEMILWEGDGTHASQETCLMIHFSDLRWEGRSFVQKDHDWITIIFISTSFFLRFFHPRSTA